MKYKIADLAKDENRIRRGSGQSVALTVRLTKADWMRLKVFAMNEGETLQTIAVKGFNRLLVAKGEKPLSGK